MSLSTERKSGVSMRRIIVFVLLLPLTLAALLTGSSPVGRRNAVCGTALVLAPVIAPVTDAAPVYTETAPNAADISIPAVKAMSDDTPVATEKMYVYDEDENKLFYNRVTGMVFSEKGVAYNYDSQPLQYDDKEQVFEDSLQRRLDLVERSTNGLQNYFLMFGEYGVRSIGIHDELYIVTIAANTAFNSGGEYEMLITRVILDRPWWSYLIPNYRAQVKYYDLHGHEIDSRYFATKYRPNTMVGIGTGAFGGTQFVKFEKWGTIQDLLDEIVYLMELVPPDGSPMGEFALNTVTGAFLRDDSGQKIRIKDGQLIDPMSWPLIGSDARPMWWREDLRAYTDHKGRLLDYGENDTLVDPDGFVPHSVIPEVQNGLRIYLVYVNIADENGVVIPEQSGKFLIPATGKTVSVDPFKMEFYDMNGVLVPEWELIAPKIDEGTEADREDNWPEEFPEPQWVRDLKNFFSGIGSGISGFFASIGEFFSKYGIWFLVGIAVIALLLTCPLWGPFVIGFIKLVVKGVIFIVRAIGRGVIAIVTAPVKLFKWLFSKKEGSE